MLVTFVIVIAVIIILVFWFKSVRLLGSLYLTKRSKDGYTVERRKMAKGAKDLQLFVGVSLILILWQAYNSKFVIDSAIRDSVTIIAVFALVGASIFAYFDFKEVLG